LQNQICSRLIVHLTPEGITLFQEPLHILRTNHPVSSVFCVATFRTATSVQSPATVSFIFPKALALLHLATPRCICQSLAHLLSTQPLHQQKAHFPRCQQSPLPAQQHLLARVHSVSSTTAPATLLLLLRLQTHARCVFICLCMIMCVSLPPPFSL
jgi:hypothetical protein